MIALHNVTSLPEAWITPQRRSRNRVQKHKSKRCQPFTVTSDVDGYPVNHDALILWRKRQFPIDVKSIDVLLRTAYINADQEKTLYKFIDGHSVRDIIDHLNNVDRLELSVGSYVVAILHSLKRACNDGKFFPRKSSGKMRWCFRPLCKNITSTETTTPSSN